MKKWVVIFILWLVSPLAATGTDFWTIYGEKLAYRHAIRGEYIPALPHTNRLTSDETLNLAVTSIGNALTQRFAQVAAEKKNFAINECAATPEPYRCYTEIILKTTLDETRFIPEIHFSDKFVKKAWKFYDKSIRPNESLSARMERARRVPPWKRFNPRINLDISEPELIAAMPFYTFFSIYVEPRWGTRNGPHLIFLKYGVSLDFDREGLLIRYNLHHYSTEKKYCSIQIHPDGSITLDSTIIVK